MSALTFTSDESKNDSSRPDDGGGSLMLQVRAEGGRQGPRLRGGHRSGVQQRVPLEHPFRATGQRHGRGVRAQLHHRHSQYRPSHHPQGQRSGVGRQVRPQSEEPAAVPPAEALRGLAYPLHGVRARGREQARHRHLQDGERRGRADGLLGGPGFHEGDPEQPHGVLAHRLRGDLLSGRGPALRDEVPRKRVRRQH